MTLPPNAIGDQGQRYMLVEVDPRLGERPIVYTDDYERAATIMLAWGERSDAVPLHIIDRRSHPEIICLKRGHHNFGEDRPHISDGKRVFVCECLDCKRPLKVHDLCTRHDGHYWVRKSLSKFPIPKIEDALAPVPLTAFYAVFRRCLRCGKEQDNL